MDENTLIHNLDLIVKDYIRVLELPAIKSKNPITILLVGVPASGKSYLAQNLARNLPLVWLSENSIQSFLVPKISFTNRGREEIITFTKEVVRQLITQKYSCIVDINLKKLRERDGFRNTIEDAGGQTIVIYLNCSADFAFERIRKRNQQIIRGEVAGFILDWDYFQYEVNTIEPPVRRERALTFDSSKGNEQLGGIITYLKGKIG